MLSKYRLNGISINKILNMSKINQLESLKVLKSVVECGSFTAAARQLARTPEQMALLAAGAGMLAVALGLAGSLQWDTPAGPSIVVAATLIFAASLALPALRR